MKEFNNLVATSASYSNAVISQYTEALQGIHLETKNIAIYQRDVAELCNELDQMAKHPVECRASGSVEDILLVLRDQLEHGSGKFPKLYADVAELLALFKRITRASSFRLLLTSVSTNMCRIFHTDINDLRLLCTYSGPGTLWLPTESIDGSSLNKSKDIKIDKSQIQQVATGDIAILKGALYPKSNPVLHRSPAIEESGEHRFLLRIDTNEFISSFS